MAKKNSKIETPVPTEPVPAFVRIRVTLDASDVLRVVSRETREKASLSLLDSIATLGAEATLPKVLALSAKDIGKLAPRSKEAHENPERFLRGYATNLLRKGFVAKVA